MEYACILILVITNTVTCYHFYNPRTHQLLESPSLNNIPTGYKLVPPPRSYARRRSSLIKDRTNGYCNDGGFTCNAPYDKSQTFQFECSNDDQCPLSFKCCSQKCFLHKICIKATPSSSSSNTPERNEKSCNNERSGQCGKWPYNCQVPYHYSMTYSFKCNQDSQCPRNFKCCQQNCFTHKICSQIVFSAKKPPEKIVPAVKTETEQTTETDEYNLIEARLYVTTPEQQEEITESSTSTTTEVTDGVYVNENSETTTEYDKEKTTTIQIKLTTEQATETVEKKTEVSTEAKFKTTIVKIAMPTVTVASKQSTLDSNAIDPNYVENFYDSNTSTEYNAYEDDGDEDYDYYEEGTNTQ